ncbi:MAG: phasin family protein [Deltaproteobacteria bacterium]|nr:phasin family protein [Deltaproteobacteria bacterium]
MLEFAEKLVLTGMGALTLSQQKLEEMVKEVRERLNLSEEEGKKLVARIQKSAEEQQKKLEKLAMEEVHKSCERIGVVSREDLKKVEKKLADLEKRLKALEG